jgi:hypothetical protein
MHREDLRNGRLRGRLCTVTIIHALIANSHESS